MSMCGASKHYLNKDFFSLFVFVYPHEKFMNILSIKSNTIWYLVYSRGIHTNDHVVHRKEEEEEEIGYEILHFFCLRR